MKRVLKILAWLLGAFLLLLVVLVIYVRSVASVSDPELSSTPSVATVENRDSLLVYGDSWFRKSRSGLYELYVTGKPFERGEAIGKLTAPLIQYQEEVFNKQINQLVPSKTYLGVLKYFVGWFNRDLDENVPQEFREEIYGVSRVASHDFDYIAPPYHRMLNYHAAHDIGHALQNMALVGCTAFATWGEKSQDSTLIVGRNFDFYVGDDFAKNKIVAFYAPDQGHRFMMVTFGGMTGVLSGMNDQGLTVTLNAAKSEIPGSSATPVSILAREILQYASTIDEAYAIAGKRKTFVAESFLIGSAKDNRAAIIEKSPEALDLFQTNENYIIGTNHFQSKRLGETELNRDHMKTSASVYRYDRVKQLLGQNPKNSVSSTAAILRDQKGLGDANIGLGNEKAVNQLIAHHAIIFQPAKQRVWISTAPWQLGKFVCYDLTQVFGSPLERNREIALADLAIGEDSFIHTQAYENMVKYNAFRFPFQPRIAIIPDSLLAWNPDSYLSYLLAGDAWLEQEEYEKAVDAYEQGLKKEIATEPERQHMVKNLAKAKQGLAQ
ncbi:MAG TPA: C45 family peptidase [Chryseosolibacter sp.]